MMMLVLWAKGLANCHRCSVLRIRPLGGNVCLGAPGIQINVLAIYPTALPRHTELGVPFSHLQKHNSFMHD